MPMTDREQRLLHALASMVEQYLADHRLYQGELDNLCMGPGEEAMALLEEYGLLTMKTGQYRLGNWTAAGRDFLELS